MPALHATDHTSVTPEYRARHSQNSSGCGPNSYPQKVEGTMACAAHVTVFDVCKKKIMWVREMASRLCFAFRSPKFEPV